MSSILTFHAKMKHENVMCIACFMRREFSLFNLNLIVHSFLSAVDNGQMQITSGAGGL